jgi:RNA polymerase sigma factor (sigma-70 family)
MRESSSDEDSFQEPAATDVNVEEVQIQTQEQQNVREAVEKLPERCRDLLELLYFSAKNPSYEQISETMKMPVASIGPTRARCLEKLRTVLRRRGIK